jgi:hypothetical protein
LGVGWERGDFTRWTVSHLREGWKAESCGFRRGQTKFAVRRPRLGLSDQEKAAEPEAGDYRRSGGREQAQIATLKATAELYVGRPEWSGYPMVYFADRGRQSALSLK